MTLTATLHGWGRSEGCPEWLGAHLTAGRHVETDRYELVALQHHRHDLVSVSVGQNWWCGVIIRFARLSLTSVQDLHKMLRHTVSRGSSFTWKILGMSLASALMTSP